MTSPIFYNGPRHFKNRVNIIAACNNNLTIGLHGKIPWYCKDDFKWFKKATLNSSLIMGRKTVESLPEPLLSHRTIYMLTRNSDWPDLERYGDGAKTIAVPNLDEALRLAFQERQPIFVAGGQSIYQQFLDRDLVKVIALTHIKNYLRGDTFFPKIDRLLWRFSHKQVLSPMADLLFFYRKCYGDLTPEQVLGMMKQ